MYGYGYPYGFYVDPTYVSVSYTHLFISAAWFGHPAEKLKTIGITGTKGKTTTTYMVKSILENAGYKVGLIGTIEAIIGNKIIPASNTTPESYVVQEYFHEMVEAGCDCVVMEAVSYTHLLEEFLLCSHTVLPCISLSCGVRCR